MCQILDQGSRFDGVGCLAHPIPFKYPVHPCRLHSSPQYLLLLLPMSSSSSSSSTSSSPVHKFSLVDPDSHSPAVLQLINVKLSKEVVGQQSFNSLFNIFSHFYLSGYAVDVIIDTVDYALGRPSSSRKQIRRPEHTKFAQFVASMLERAEVTMPTLLVTLVYVQRAKYHLHIGLEQWALERVFLGALIVASKVYSPSHISDLSDPIFVVP